MNPPPFLDLREECRVNWRWLALRASFPLLYIGLIVAPQPFGLGYDFGNDFADHRIWWVQVPVTRLFSARFAAALA